jgi:two-component system sensor kinase FixL
MDQEENRRRTQPLPAARSSRAISILIGLFSAAIILVIWSAIFIQSRIERQIAIDTAIRENQNRVIALEYYVNRTLQGADTALIDLIHDYGSGYGTPANPRRITDPALRSRPIAAVSVVDAQGYLVAGSADSLRPYFSVADQQAFKVHATGSVKGPYVAVPTYSRRLGRNVINITRRINRSDAKFLGVVAVAIYPEALVDLQSQANVSSHDLMSVIGEDGITRARRSGNKFSFGEDLNGLPVMDFHRRRPNGTYLGPGGLDGVWRYFSHRTLKDYPLFVTAGVARHEIIAASRARQRYYIGAAALLTLFVAAFALLLNSYIQRRQKTAGELANAIDRLHEAQRIAGIGDWEHDLVSGKIVWSDQLFAMYGRDPAEGAPTFAELLSYFDDEGRAAVQRAHRAAVKTGESQEHEQAVYLADGRVAYHLTKVVARRDGAGRVTRLHGTAQDISAGKLLETLQAKLTHLSRIDAMNTMAATLAHELNQPLTAAANYMAGTKRILEKLGPEFADILRDGVGGAEKQLLLAGNIIRRMRDMIADRSAKFEEAKLSEIVGDALSLLAMTKRHPNTSVTVHFDPDADLVSADPVQIQQVLINLIRNANDAMEGQSAPEIFIATSRHGDDEIRLCVTDKGNGIPPSIGDLFSTFSTSKQNGLGIGLSISRTIVEAHGGRIWVDKTDRDGTAICFTLPAVGGGQG